ncbi:MAG: PfkB family carbohydrate kinase, partial [Ilumatobacteraceae bacterium]
MQWDVCVVGSLNVDLVVRVPRHPEVGETVIGSTFETFLGGKGFNQALAAARAGGRTAIVGAVGEDGHGDDLLTALGADGIDARGVRRVAGGTGTAFPVVDDEGRNTVIVVPLANHAVDVADVERLAGLIGGARVVLVQLELRLEAVVAAVTTARR